MEDDRDASFTALDATQMDEFPVAKNGRKGFARSLSEEDASNMEALEKTVDPDVKGKLEDVSDTNFTATDFKNMSEFARQTSLGNNADR